jgi:hypothetical protein
MYQHVHKKHFNVRKFLSTNYIIGFSDERDKEKGRQKRNISNHHWVNGKSGK